MKTNYLGIKNQGTWELYIKQTRGLILSIPQSEAIEKEKLTIELDKDEALVKELARINQVEKAVFQKQYDELVSRMNKVKGELKLVEDHFLNIYNPVVSRFEFAKEVKSREIAKGALEELSRVGSCERSSRLKEEIEEFINSFLSDYVEDLSSNINHKVYLEKAFKDLKMSIRGEVYNLVAAEKDNKHYEINMNSTNNNKKIFINKKQTDDMIVYGGQDKTRRAASSYNPLITQVSFDLYKDDIMKRENFDFFEGNVEVSESDSRKVSYKTYKNEKYGSLSYKFTYDDKENTIYVTGN